MRRLAPPALVLPPWAVDEDILDLIEALTFRAAFSDQQTGTKALMQQIRAMRSFLREKTNV